MDNFYTPDEPFTGLSDFSFEPPYRVVGLDGTSLDRSCLRI